MRCTVFFHVMSASCRMPMFAFVIRPFFGIRMPFGGTCFYYSVRFITTVALCSFCAVLGASDVAVRNVVSKLVTERFAVLKCFRSFFAAFAGKIILCFFGTGCRCRQIFIADNLFCITMVQLGIYIFYRILFVTTVALCRFCAVLRASCVVVRNVIRKTMSERIATCKSLRSLFAATARIVIFCRFGTGGFQSKILLFYFLLGKRMRMLFLTADKADCRT